jgi:hypothetical protein
MMVLQTEKIRNGIGKTGFRGRRRPAQRRFGTFRDVIRILLLLNFLRLGDRIIDGNIQLKLPLQCKYFLS